MTAINSESTVVWGAKGIARVINLSPVAVYHLLEEGRIPARKVGRRWCAVREDLINHLRTGAAGGAS